jgi:hypothetical protein
MTDWMWRGEEVRATQQLSSERDSSSLESVEAELILIEGLWVA